MKRIKTYKKERKNYLNGIDHMRSRMKRYILSLVIIAAAVIIFSVFATIDMRLQNARSTKLYAKNYTEQIAEMINTDVGNHVKMAESFAESERLQTDDAAGDFLESKRKLYQYDFAVYYNEIADTESMSGFCPLKKQEMSSLAETEAFYETLDRGLCAVGIKKGYVLYAKNTYQAGKKTGTLWIGYQEKKLQDIFVTKILQKENCVSYIIKDDGCILLSSNAENRNLNLAVLLGNDTNTRKHIDEMTDNIKKEKNGVFRFRSGDHKAYYLSYASTGIEKWIAVTMIPTDYFNGFYDSYVEKMLGSLLAALAVFGALFLLLFKNYREYGRRIERIALYDEVTGGINRIEFQMKYQELCRKKKAAEYTLVLMDCMDFKMINDSLGTKNGDRMLKYFYQVICSFLYPDQEEFAARIEMDHFFLCLREKNPDIIGKRLERIVSEINSFRNTDLSEWDVSFWMGACTVENNETDLTVLQDQARVVVKHMTRQKAGTLVFFDSCLAEKIQREREMERIFEESLLHGDFQVFFQPKVNFKEGKVSGAEALVRWEMPEKGMIPPGEFIPLLESNGKICMLDRYVFERVCQCMQKWKCQGRNLFPVSVNLSRSHFINENFLSDFIRIADRYQIDRSLIEFEITETIFLDASQIRKVKEGLHFIHQYGFRSSLDDFGFGFSSLTLLREFDIDVLKLDRSFFSDMENKKARSVISSIVNMAEGLGIKIVAEGIETEDQIRCLETVNCCNVQGYFFSRPLPVSEFEVWVEEFDIRNYL